jgi:hypothetical protein
MASREFFFRFRANSIRRASSRVPTDNPRNDELDRCAEAVRRVIAASAVFGQPPLHILSRTDVITAG